MDQLIVFYASIWQISHRAHYLNHSDWPALQPSSTPAPPLYVVSEVVSFLMPNLLYTRGVFAAYAPASGFPRRPVEGQETPRSGPDWTEISGSEQVKTWTQATSKSL